MNKPTFKDLYYLCVQKLTNFPYIEENFDALTNYELLCKVVEELNKMIDNMNTQNQSIIALYNAFNTLKTYVDTYFENLDVQEEINNKLDEMAEDGTLTSLIEEYVNPYLSEFNNRITTIENNMQGVLNGSPIPVNELADMTDTEKLYLLLSDNYVYYYDGTNWIQGWIYQAAGVITDKSLMQIGVAADSNATGINIKSLKKELQTGKYNVLNFKTFEHGNITSQGVDGDSQQSSYPFSIRSVGYTQIQEGKCLIKPNGFYIMLFEYNNDYSLNQRSNWITSDTFYTFDSSKLYRMCISDYTNRSNSDLLWKDIIEILKEVDSNVVYPKYINVGENYEFQTLKAAIDSITNASKNNPYNILIHEGEYNTLEGFDLPTVSSSFVGLVIPDYVNLIGIGSNKEIILKAELPADISSYSFPRDNVSTINVWRNNIVKNLTITAKNMRYAIHNDDFKTNAVEGAKELFEDLIVIYENNDTDISSVSVPMGIGAYNGRETIIRNCIFDGKEIKGHSLLIHNNIDSPNKCKWEIENCRFYGNQYSLGLSSAGSNQEELVVLKGCKLEKNIRYSKQTSYQSNINEYYLTGYTNVIPGYTYSNIIEDLSKIDVINTI